MDTTWGGSGTFGGDGVDQGSVGSSDPGIASSPSLVLSQDKPSTTKTINDLTWGDPTVEVNFTWSPASTFTYIAGNGVILTGPSAQHGVPIIFTGVASITYDPPDRLRDPQGLQIIQYKWEFGDGTSQTFNYTTQSFLATYTQSNLDTKTQHEIEVVEFGLGLTPTHTYRFPNFQTHTTLRITDNMGKYWYARKQLYLF